MLLALTKDIASQPQPLIKQMNYWCVFSISICKGKFHFVVIKDVSLDEKVSI
jgi:hypothetical protein